MADNAIDWDQIRKVRYADYPGAPGWTEGVKPISQDGLVLLGVHPETNELYWDGKLIEVRKSLVLTAGQKAGAVIVSGSAVVVAVLDVLRFILEWTG